MVLKKGSKIYAILGGVCPKCHEESMYTNKNPYAIGELFSMHEQCSNCNTKYKIEPSFFYGSMYVSYGVGIAFAVVAFLISFFIFKSSLMIAFISIVGALLIFYPIIIRISRNIWINIFISFDKTLAKKMS